MLFFKMSGHYKKVVMVSLLGGRTVTKTGTSLVDMSCLSFSGFPHWIYLAIFVAVLY